MYIHVHTYMCVDFWIIGVGFKCEISRAFMHRRLILVIIRFVHFTVPIIYITMYSFLSLHKIISSSTRYS